MSVAAGGAGLLDVCLRTKLDIFLFSQHQSEDDTVLSVGLVRGTLAPLGMGALNKKSNDQGAQSRLFLGGHVDRLWMAGRWNELIVGGGKGSLWHPFAGELLYCELEGKKYLGRKDYLRS